MIKYIKAKYSDLNILLTKKLKYIYFLNFFINFFVSFLEIIGIGSIVIYISIIIDPLNLALRPIHMFQKKYLSLIYLKIILFI